MNDPAKNSQAQEKIDLSGDGQEPDKVVPLKEYEALLNKIKELEGLREKLLVHAADFENAKKRLAKEKEEFLKFGQESLIRNLLPILDNFERAMMHKQDSNPALKNMIIGIEMIYKQLTEVLKSQGLKRLETKDKDFDPHLHEAIAFVQEPGEENKIIEEVEPGYLLHDRLLRASKVRVRASHDAASAGPSEDQI